MKLPEGHARDILVAVAVVGGILLALYLYTGTWPPPVVVESNSMMHIDADEYTQNFGDTRPEDVPYGRWGTVDPGDLVLVKDIDDQDRVDTYAHAGDDRYGDPGEVVVYFTNEHMAGTPIIHRAMTYVTALDSNGEPIRAGQQHEASVDTYEVVWHPSWDTNVACGEDDDPGTLGAEDGECEEPASCTTQGDHRVCRFDEAGFRLPELAREVRFEDDVYAPPHSGFITQGDNVVGNEAPDQALGIHDEPVPLGQVQGIARGELPWFGLIKLALTGDPTATAEVQDHPYYLNIGQMTAPQDLWVMLLVGLGVVAFAPVALDYGWVYARRRIADETQDPAPPPPGPSQDPPPDPPGNEDDEAGDEGDAQDEGNEDTQPDKSVEIHLEDPS